MLKKEFKDRELQSDNIDVNNILDLVLLSEELFISPIAVMTAVKVVGPSRCKVIAHLRSDKGLNQKGESVTKPPPWILADGF